LTLSFAVLVLWMVPWTVRVMTMEPYSVPFTLWSPVVEDFVSLDRTADEWRFVDSRGNEYLGDTSDNVLPLYYASDVFSRGDMPDSLGGKGLTPEAIDFNRVIITQEPARTQKVLPKVYLLMESETRRSSLEDPALALVSRKDGMHVYEMDGNREDEALSAAFNEAMDGFSHPVRMASGNPSDRKPYDEGWLFVDSGGVLWHVKLAGGKPLAERFDFPGEAPINGILITECENRATLGYVTGADGKLWLLRPDGEFVGTEVRYDPANDDFMNIGDLLCYTMSVSNSEGVTYHALDADDFSLMGTLHREFPEDKPSAICTALLPFRLWFVSGDDGFVRPRFADFSPFALGMNFILAIAWGMLARKRRYRWLDYPAVVLGGVFMAIPLWLLRE